MRNDDTRVMARQLAEVRELSLDELKLIAGGAGTTFTHASCDWGPTQESTCGWSDSDPCDLDWITSD